MSFEPIYKTRRILVILWALPTTLLGLFFAFCCVLFGAKFRREQGVFEIFGGRLTKTLARGGFVAVSLGHLIIGLSAQDLDALRVHERVHVRQAERWGVFFVPVYLCLGVWQWLCGRHAYYDHPFEREAFGAEGRVIDKKSP